MAATLIPATARQPGPRTGRTWPPTGYGLPPLRYGIYWNVYANSGRGDFIADPIDYNTPIAVLPQPDLSWLTPSLTYPATWCFGLRAADASGQEENHDAAVMIILDAQGNDITARPAP